MLHVGRISALSAGFRMQPLIVIPCWLILLIYLYSHMAILSRSAPNGLQKKHLYKYIQIFGIHKVYDTSREYKCQNSNNITKTKHN